MNVQNLLNTFIPATALVIAAVSFEALAGDPVTLYRDEASGQIYSEPGPGRQPIGQLKTSEPAAAAPAVARKPAWYEKLSLRGYTQFRFNQGLNGGAEDLRSPGDRFIGENQSFGLRRARLILSGDLGENVRLYMQPDFASTPAGSSTSHFGQLRDLYADIYVDKAHEHRFRVGQSKVPYGFENLQSSSNRLTLDRADALNTAVRDERDIGVFYYYAPDPIAKRFAHLIKDGLKGSGDYGMLGIGVYNGQGANRAEANDQLHTVLHSSYPLQLASGQIIEFGMDAYRGRYVPSVAKINIGGDFTPTIDAPERGVRDERIAAHVVVYPQPFGFQAEWTAGRGPELNVSNKRIEAQALRGGYVQAMYRYKSSHGEFLPYVKAQTYRGASKFDTNAPHFEVDEVEAGVEWQIVPELELVTAFSHMERTQTTIAPYAVANGNLLRMQLQWNY